MDALEIINKRSELFTSFEAIAQNRSNFALEKFVVGKELTEERKFAQVVYEMQLKQSYIRRLILEKARLERDMADASDDIEAALKQVDIDDKELEILGQTREFNGLYAIYESLPKFTYEQIQAAEPAYWLKRLSLQSQIDLDTMGVITGGNVEALRQLGLITDEGLVARFHEVAALKPELFTNVNLVSKPGDTNENSLSA